MAAEWLTIKQSGGQKHFTKERNTPIRNKPRGSLGLEASNSSFPTIVPDNFDIGEQVDCLSNRYYSPL